MTAQPTIRTGRDGPFATLTLNRPEVRNAFNLQMIRELSDAIGKLDPDKQIRAVVLNAAGPHFSAGADLNWMKEGIGQSEEQLRSESLLLAELFRTIAASDVPYLAAIRGNVMGGGIGLVAASDLVVAEDTVRFAFTEGRLGLVPATIAPYVLRKAGLSRTTELMLTGRTFDAEEAREAGLVHLICKEGELNRAVSGLREKLTNSGPAALRGIKAMLRNLEGRFVTDAVKEYTSELIAGFRVSEEGQEGMNAFFEKRKPRWDETS